ncbi:hypothetical protein GCM10009037_24610 [Halarchaeum grantii]|uniref:PD-(D/E)XK nuclease superfamily protein n=1 Tax=Halarchaeum grantii TaxID=1193105 RepID=A0A830FC69_9EURY|nr:hypothetical protein [Halarchaeum grantii]GGL39874.1 hypothetical protein GCM10009037_24610 [Halarchaeum grantii]
MRPEKTFLFHDDGGPEKNTVHALLKTLHDTHPKTTLDFLRAATHDDPTDWGTDLHFGYRSEVTTSDPQDEPRYLVGLSTNNRLLRGEPGDQDSQIDARIQAYEGEERKATIFIEAKVGSNTLNEGQLRRYAKDFDITEIKDDTSWTQIQWADVYTTLRDHIDSECNDQRLRSEWTVNEYLLSELTDWLRSTDQIQRRVGESAINNSHPKYLNVGVNDDSEYYIQFAAESYGESTQSGTATITEPVWKRFLNKIDEDTRRATFGVPTENQPEPTPDLTALRNWLISSQGYQEKDFQDKGRRWAWEIDRENYPLKIKFRRDDHLWVRTKPNVHYCPNLAPDEFEAVFDDIPLSLREDVFINGNLSPLWTATN